jgi:alkyl hydroperoxide reductase subunit F
VLAERAKTADNVEFLLGWEVIEIKGDTMMTGMRVKKLSTGETRDIAAEGIFIEIGLEPITDYAKGFVELNARGEIQVDCSCRTNVEGVFAAGDVTNVPDKQIIIAAGEGAKAALAAYQYLIRLKG